MTIYAARTVGIVNKSCFIVNNGHTEKMEEPKVDTGITNIVVYYLSSPNFSAYSRNCLIKSRQEMVHGKITLFANGKNIYIF